MSKRIRQPKHPLKISKLPFALLRRYMASGFVRFGPRPFRSERYESRVIQPLRPAA